MCDQDSPVIVPRKRPRREVIQNRPVTPIMVSLFEEYAREYLAGAEQRAFGDFLAGRLNVTRASAERMMAYCLVYSRVTYTALKVGMLGALDAADRAGRDVLEDVA